MTGGWCHAADGFIRLSVQVSPNAKKTEVSGVAGDVLRVRLHAPPVDGKANEELIRFIAERLGLPKRVVQLASGHANKRKLLHIDDPGLDIDAVAARLLATG